MAAEKPAARRPDGRKRRWQQHNAERRQGVLDAAVVVLGRLEPGSELNVQQVADEAGMHRTVLYRYFEDRTDLEVAIQQEICDRAAVPLLGAVTLEGSPREIVHRIVSGYVAWGAENVALMRFAERDIPGAASKPLDVAINQIAEQIELVIGGFLAVLAAEVADDERHALTPFVHLLVGGVMAAVRHWSSRAELLPAPEAFTRMLADATWRQVDGFARAAGIEVPDLPVEQLLGVSHD